MQVFYHEKCLDFTIPEDGLYVLDRNTGKYIRPLPQLTLKDRITRYYKINPRIPNDLILIIPDTNFIEGEDIALALERYIEK